MDTVTKTDSVSSTRTLCEFLASIRYEQIPAPVIARTEELFLDWFASALAGKDARLVAEAAESVGLQLPLVEAIAAQFARGVEAGHGEEDMAATVRTARASAK